MRFPATHGVSIKQSLEQGWAIPSSWYYDAEIFEAEQRNIFAVGWHYVCRADQLAEVGSYVATVAAGIPVVVVRDKEGALRAFLNICPHRAHEVAQGEGRRQTLQCPYHAWTFDLDGSLRAAPRSECEADFDPSEVSLLPAAVAQWGPLVFVNAAEDPVPFEEAFEGLPRRAEEMHLAFEEYEFFERRGYDIACNWKVFLDNATECYHCEPVHRGFADRFSTVTEDFKANLVAGERSFSYSIPFRDPALRNGDDFQLYFGWPSFLILAERDRFYWATRFDAVSPTETRVVEDFFFHRSIPVEDRAAELELMSEAIQEDVDVNESVQRGLNTNRLPQARFFLHEESLLGHVQSSYYDALQRA